MNDRNVVWMIALQTVEDGPVARTQFLFDFSLVSYFSASIVNILIMLSPQLTGNVWLKMSVLVPLHLSQIFDFVLTTFKLLMLAVR